MKFSALVLRNIRQGVLSVGFQAVADALLSGGVCLDEIVLLPYDDPAALPLALKRLKGECDGVFVICDGVLLSAVKEGIEGAVGGKFADALLETEECLIALIAADGEGAKLVASDVVPAVDKRRGQSFFRVVLKTVLAPPEEVLAAVEEVSLSGARVMVHTSEEYGVGRIEVVYHSSTPKVEVDEAVRILASALEKYLYAMEDVTVGERLFEALKLHRLKISTAESFTGGGVGEAIVSNPGASKVFFEGLNTYANEAKAERLGVSEYTLKSKGAVSEDTAYEMAAGLLKTGNCDVAVATTGIAGPESDGSGTPPGTCFLAVGTRERVRVFEYLLKGDRNAITKQAVNLALFLAYKEIN